MHRQKYSLFLAMQYRNQNSVLHCMQRNGWQSDTHFCLFRCLLHFNATERKCEKIEKTPDNTSTSTSVSITTSLRRHFSSFIFLTFSLLRFLSFRSFSLFCGWFLLYFILVHLTHSINPQAAHMTMTTLYHIVKRGLQKCYGLKKKKM